MTWIETDNLPFLGLSVIFIKAFLERSISKPFVKGPLSFIITSTLLLFFKFVILTLVPKARVLCAAVNLLFEKRSPLAVLLPLNLS